MNILGIDIGGSGIKGCVVDTQSGVFLGERLRVPTPEGAAPEAVAGAVAEIVKAFAWQGKIGCGFPGVIQGGEARTAANLDKRWVGVAVGAYLGKASGCPMWVLNDADAAGLGEIRFGQSARRVGVELVLTLGTGIGSALFVDGRLVPNSELGHLYLRVEGENRAVHAESWTSDAARKREDLSWKKWALRLNTYLEQVHFILRPERIILGGGAAKRADKFLEFLACPVPVEVATLRNRAGIVGAALAARENLK